MSQAAGVDVQSAWPAGEYWKVRVSTPEPTSSELALRATVPVSWAPGSSIVPVGGVLSTLTVSTADVVTLPAWSVADARRS